MFEYWKLSTLQDTALIIPVAPTSVNIDEVGSHPPPPPLFPQIFFTVEITLAT